MNADNPTEPNGSPWPAQGANAAEKKSSNSGPSQGNGQHTFSPVGLLVVKAHRTITQEDGDRMKALLEPIAKRLNLETVVVDSTADVAAHYDPSVLVEALTLQVAAINRLADSNEALVQAMAQEDDEDPEPSSYLDGRPRPGF